MKVGDKVTLIIGSPGEHFPRVRTIERETKKYYIVNGIKFCKKSLRSCGDSWYHDRIEYYDEITYLKLYEEKFPRVAAKALPRISWKDYPSKFLCKVFKMCVEESKRMKALQSVKDKCICERGL